MQRCPCWVLMAQWPKHQPKFRESRFVSKEGIASSHQLRESRWQVTWSLTPAVLLPIRPSTPVLNVSMTNDMWCVTYHAWLIHMCFRCSGTCFVFVVGSSELSTRSSQKTLLWNASKSKLLLTSGSQVPWLKLQAPKASCWKKLNKQFVSSRLNSWFKLSRIRPPKLCIYSSPVSFS